MKRMDFTRSKNLSEFKDIIEKTSKYLPVNIKHIVIAVVLITFTLPINKQVLADKKIKPGKRQATLILSDGRQIVLNASSDTIVNSQTKNICITVDSTGINYVIVDSLKKRNKSVKKK